MAKNMAKLVEFLGMEFFFSVLRKIDNDASLFFNFAASREILCLFNQHLCAEWQDGRVNKTNVAFHPKKK
jgi:hypothetical protein